MTSCHSITRLSRSRSELVAVTCQLQVQLTPQTRYRCLWRTHRGPQPRCSDTPDQHACEGMHVDPTLSLLDFCGTQPCKLSIVQLPRRLWNNPVAILYHLLAQSRGAGSFPTDLPRRPANPVEILRWGVLFLRCAALRWLHLQTHVDLHAGVSPSLGSSTLSQSSVFTRNALHQCAVMHGR